MKVTVVFPKASCYDGKSLDTQRIYGDVFRKYLNMLSECNCSVEYMLEDKLAGDFLKDFKFKDSKVITCVSQSDIKFFNDYRDLVDLQPNVYQEYFNAENNSGVVEKQYTVPINLIRENREEYIRKRVEVYRKRRRVASDILLRSRKAVLMFRADNGTDWVSALRSTIADGDGRLCIEVNINSNGAIAYYGGAYLQEDYLPTVLSM
jgi:hypothetical protein